MKPITNAWLDRARDDLDAIKQLLKKEHLTNVVAFHAQQVVEKTFKAVIEELELDFVKTHNLTRLHELVKPHYDIVQDMDMLEQLDAVYTESRYPDDMGFVPFGKANYRRSQTFL